MDSANSFGNSHSEEEADIIHFRQDSENHDDENHPSRPVSRLGFNRPALSPERHESHNSEAIQWSRSLFQSIGISNLRLPNLKTHSEHALETDALETDISSSAHSTSDIGDISGIKEDFESPYGNEDMSKYAMVVRKPSTSPLPVSRLSFPFVTTPSPRRDKATPSLRPHRRHKYSCFPSSMSPEPAAYPSPSPPRPRHSYRQHGYSRLALQHLKWFWSLREHEWEASNTDLRSANPYNGVSDVEPVVVHHVPAPYAYVVRTSPTTIHPRRGDITALRDPFSFHIDRYFSDLASWTFGKILWMIDMHASMEKRKLEVDMEQDVSDEESESELETSASTGFSDDSDSTLVESESEGDLLNLRNAILDSSIPMINDDAELPQVLSVGYLDNTKWSQSVYTHISRLDRKDLPWATNWYGRWAFLIDISRADKNRKHLLFDPAAPPIGFIPNTKDDTGPHFTLAGKHKYLENDELCL